MVWHVWFWEIFGFESASIFSHLLNPSANGGGYWVFILLAVSEAPRLICSLILSAPYEVYSFLTILHGYVWCFCVKGLWILLLVYYLWTLWFTLTLDFIVMYWFLVKGGVFLCFLLHISFIVCSLYLFSWLYFVLFCQRMVNFGSCCCIWVP